MHGTINLAEIFCFALISLVRAHKEDNPCHFCTSSIVIVDVQTFRIVMQIEKVLTMAYSGMTSTYEDCRVIAESLGYIVSLLWQCSQFYK